jgi:glycosyltransferase involved in cell wall biosynthesis
MSGGSPPIRIAFCHYTADVHGGSDRSLFELATHLPRERFVPSMILRTGDPMAPRYRAAGIAVREVGFVPPRRSVQGAALLRFGAAIMPNARAVARAVRESGADVVHVNTSFNLQGALGARIARRPLVWHVRELGAGAVVDRLLLGVVARLATRAVAISPAVAATLSGCGVRLRLVLNGIDLAAFEHPPTRMAARGDLGIDAAARVVAMLGRLEPWKGQDVGLDAFAAVAARDPRAILLVIGGPAATKPAFGPALEARAVALGLGDRVRFLGIRHDVPRLLAAADVLISPTVRPEPFGRTLVEAMAVGVPVIASAAGGPLEIVVPGESGLLVPPGSSSALAEAMGRVLGDDGLASRLAAAGRQRAVERYALSRVVREMSDVFEDVRPGRPAGLPTPALVAPT